MSVLFEGLVVLLLSVIVLVLVVYMDNGLNVQVTNAESVRTHLLVISAQLNALQQIAMHPPALEPTGPLQESSTQTTPPQQQ